MISLNDSIIEPSFNIEASLDDTADKGNLAFTDGGNKSFVFEKYNVSANRIQQESPQLTQTDNLPLEFNVKSARIVKFHNEKFVIYTITICRPNDSSNCAIIERRYTDFCMLQASLKKCNFVSLQDINFPPRVMLGNFQFKTIYGRSRAFERYLCQLAMIREIFQSKYFQQFLLNPEKIRVLCAFSKHEYQIASKLLQNIQTIESLLFENYSFKTLDTDVLLCCALKKTRNYRKSWETSLKILQSIIVNACPVAPISRYNKRNKEGEVGVEFDHVISLLQNYLQKCRRLEQLNQVDSQEYDTEVSTRTRKFLLPVLGMSVEIALLLGHKQDSALLHSIAERIEYMYKHSSAANHHTITRNGQSKADDSYQNTLRYILPATTTNNDNTNPLIDNDALILHIVSSDNNYLQI